jgi:hypothetical protein
VKLTTLSFFLQKSSFSHHFCHSLRYIFLHMHIIIITQPPLSLNEMQPGDFNPNTDDNRGSIPVTLLRQL